MTFLALWAGLVGEAIALPILVVFYLLKLRRRPVRVSSTLLWERATHDLQVNTPLRWLRPSWLLLIQLLALLAFLGALARPALKDAGLAASRIVIILDRSASMSARDGRNPPPGKEAAWTRLDEAKARAEDLARRLGRSGGGSRSEAMVVAVAASAQTTAPFTSSTATLIDAIRSIQPSDQPATAESLARVLRAVGPREEGESPSGIETTTSTVAAYLLSDGALGTDEGGTGPLPQASGVLLSPIRVGPDPIVGPKPGHDSLAIVAINARRDYDDPAQVRLFLRIQNAMAQPIDTAIDIQIDGEAIETRPVHVPSATIMEPGELPVSLSFVRTAGGILTARILRADLLDADNSASMVLLPPRKPAVLAVGLGGVGPGGAGDSRGLDPFLLSALQELDLGRLVIVDRAGLEGMLAQSRSRAAADDPLAGFDLIVFDRVRPSSLPSIATLSFGAAPPIPGVELAPLTLEKDKPAPMVRFLAWQRSHPVLRDVGLDPVIITPPMRLTLPTTQSDPSLTITPFAQGPDGPLLILFEGRGVRRILVPFELGRTNWGPDISFPVFIANAVEFLSLRGQSAAAISHTTAEPISVRVTPGATPLRVTGPLAFEVDAGGRTVADTPDGGTVPLGTLERAGVYSVAGARPPDDHLAINLADPAESRLQVFDRAGSGGAEAGLAENRSQGPRELWPWFVLVGLALASVEWVIYALRMRA